MKYILILGLFYKKYKKDIRVQVFSGETLIDDIVSDKDIEKRHIPKNDVVGLRAEKYFCFEVNGDALSDNITVKCTLHDNNYTNGFMTKTAVARIECIALVPKSFVTNFCPYSRLKRWGKEQSIYWNNLMEKFGLDEAFILNSRKDKQYFQVIDLVRKLKSNRIKYKNLKPKQKALIYNYQVNENVAYWPSNPFNIKLHQDGKVLDARYWLGGEFKAVVPLIRKHGVIMCDPYPEEKKYGMIKFVRTFGKLFRKYQTVNTSR